MAFTPAAEVQKQSTSSTATTISSSTASADMFTGGPSVQHVENKIRAHIFALRIRLREIFEDFDKLRSGSMSVAQFRRCVSSALEKVVSPMTEQEYAVLIKNYDKGNGMIKWTAFVDSIDRGIYREIERQRRCFSTNLPLILPKVFGAKSLEQSPTKLTLAPHEGNVTITVNLCSNPLLHLTIRKCRFAFWFNSSCQEWKTHVAKLAVRLQRSHCQTAFLCQAPWLRCQVLVQGL